MDAKTIDFVVKLMQRMSLNTGVPPTHPRGGISMQKETSFKKLISVIPPFDVTLSTFREWKSLIKKKLENHAKEIEDGPAGDWIGIWNHRHITS